MCCDSTPYFDRIGILGVLKKKEELTTYVSACKKGVLVSVLVDDATKTIKGKERDIYIYI